MGAQKLSLINFLIVYLLLIIVLVIMRRSNINKTKQLIVASLRMTIQLVIAGYVLTMIFKNPHPVFTILYIMVMTAFAIYKNFSRNKWMNRSFKIAVAGSISFSGLSILIFFIIFIVNQNMFNPQYTIPLGGMIIGNVMTGISLALKTFRDIIQSKRYEIESLQNLGVSPKKILNPYVNSALETAIIPTLNSMVGMGIVSLPGMMTGQILSGTVPTTAIMYQIAIMISICTAVCMSVFGCLHFGYQSLYNKKNQIQINGII